MRNRLLTLGLLASSLALLASPPARAQLSFTQEEINVYRQRAGLVPSLAPGPFYSQGDTASKMGPFAPGDFVRIKQYADDFRSSPNDTGIGTAESLDIWTGYRNGKIDSSLPGAPQYPIWHGVKLQCAAFWYLLTGDTSYSGPVRRTLLRQVAVGKTTNLANWPTTTRKYPSDESATQEGKWLTRLLLGKTYVKAVLSPSEAQVLDNWFLGAANYYMARHVRRYTDMFPNRGSGDYTVRRYLADPAGVRVFLPNDPIYIMAQGDNNWAGDGRVYKYIDSAGRLGPKIARIEEFYNNRMMIRLQFIGLVGVELKVPYLVDEAYRTCTEFIRFGISREGAPGEFERNGDYGSPSQGLWYHAINVQTMVILADAMARIGDLRLYQFTTSDGAHSTTGGPKSLELVVNYFMRACAGKNKHYFGSVAPANRIDNFLEVPNRFGLRYMTFDYLGAIANKYYRNPEWKRIYQHTEPGTVPIPASGYSSAAEVWLPWAGTGAELMAGYGLHADMENRANPYKLCGPGGPRIMSLVLVNAATDQDIGVMRSGMVINLTTGPAPAYNVRVSTCPDSVGSVEYVFTRILPVSRTEIVTNRPPYAFHGWTAGDFTSWIPDPGQYRLQARIWPGPNKTGGQPGPFTEVSLEVRKGVKP